MREGTKALKARMARRREGTQDAKARKARNLANSTLLLLLLLSSSSLFQVGTN